MVDKVNKVVVEYYVVDEWSSFMCPRRPVYPDVRCKSSPFFPIVADKIAKAILLQKLHKG